MKYRDFCWFCSFHWYGSPKPSKFFHAESVSFTQIFDSQRGLGFLWELGISELHPQVGTPLPRKKSLEFKGLPSRECLTYPTEREEKENNRLKHAHFLMGYVIVPWRVTMLTLKGFLTTRPLIKPFSFISWGKLRGHWRGRGPVRFQGGSHVFRFQGF